MSSEDGEEMAKKSGAMFMECSAKSGHNIDALMMKLSETILGRIEKGEISPKNEAIGVKIGVLEA